MLWGFADTTGMSLRQGRDRQDEEQEVLLQLLLSNGDLDQEGEEL